MGGHRFGYLDRVGLLSTFSRNLGRERAFRLVEIQFQHDAGRVVINRRRHVKRNICSPHLADKLVHGGARLRMARGKWWRCPVGC